MRWKLVHTCSTTALPGASGSVASWPARSARPRASVAANGKRVTYTPRMADTGAARRVMRMQLSLRTFRFAPSAGIRLATIREPARHLAVLLVAMEARLRDLA